MFKEDVRVVKQSDAIEQSENSIQVNTWISRAPNHMGKQVCSIQTIILDSTEDLDEYTDDEMFCGAEEMDIEDAIDKAVRIAMEHDIHLVVINDKTSH